MILKHLLKLQVPHSEDLVVNGVRNRGINLKSPLLHIVLRLVKDIKRDLVDKKNKTTVLN